MKYFMTISYLGTRYRGMQRCLGRKSIDNFTVQGILEEALKRYQPTNVPALNICSRTDKGVHAFKNAVHFYLNHPKEPHEIFDPSLMLSGLNRYFEKQNEDIQVRSVTCVADDFYVNDAVVYRLYLYRLAIIQESIPNFKYKGALHKLLHKLPMAELNRCHVSCLPFDVEKSIEAAALFEGKHDYKSLVKRSKVIHEDLLITEGNVDTIWMTPGRGLMTECLDPLYKNILFYDYWFKAPAFLRQQIRRMMSVIMEVGKGNLQLNEVKWLLENPDFENWCKFHLASMKPGGLYLADIKFDVPDSKIIKLHL